MYINDKCYCSRCLKEIEPGSICKFCGFDADDYQEPEYALPLDAFLNDRYQIGCVIGAGGFGITYAGWDIVLNKPVAVKEFFPRNRVNRNTEMTFSVSASVDKEDNQVYQKGVEWFQREARILAALGDTPNIVRVEDYFKGNSTAYIILDFIRGKTLETFMKEKGGKLSSKEVFGLMKKIIEALTKVHQFGLIHRDISIKNVMIDENGEVFLIDFGAATSLEEQSELKSLDLFANMEFSAPEQREGKEQGEWTDIYSVCATMVCLMTGEKIPSSEERQKNDTIPTILKDLNLNTRQRNALIHGLALEGKQRTQNTHYLLYELYQVPLPKSEEEKRKQKRRTRRLVAALAVTYAFLIGFFGLELEEQIPLLVEVISTRNVGKALDLAEDYANGYYPFGKIGAEYWHQWVVENGTAEQICLVADRYFIGEYSHLSRNMEYAVELWEECCQKNYSGAYNALGCQYLEGTYLEQSNEKAVEYFEKGIELGNSDCMVNRAHLYMLDKKTHEKAFDLYLKAAKAGNYEGMYYLATLYDSGLGTEQNLQLALQWMLKACEAGHPNAMASIGYYYLTNDFDLENGTNWKDIGSGLLWLSEATFMGSPNAKFYMGLVYLGEIDVSGSAYAEDLYKRDEKLAFYYILESAEQNHVYAMLKVAQMYEEGIGTEIDLKLAQKWYEQAKKYEIKP